MEGFGGLFGDPEELQRRCAKHVRRSVGAPDERNTGRGGQGGAKKGARRENEAAWAKNLDERLAMMLERDKIDPREHGGEHFDG